MKREKSISVQSGSIKQNNDDYTYSFPIVAIGASAGGLKAFESFISGVPTKPKPNMAFIFIQHLSPNHKSLLVDIIQKYTKMNVYEITKDMKVEPNNVYIIPSSTDISLRDGFFIIEHTSPNSGMKLPINHFFGSLAKERKDEAIGIIMSGNGTDGTYGLEAIKQEHGFILAQDPNNCEYKSMPAHAIESGLVDHIALPEDMFSIITKYITRNKNTPKMDITGVVFDKIFDTLFKASSIDFSTYKKGTIVRRIQRRMYSNKIDNIEDYSNYLNTSEDESSLLVNDLLIGVTNFFRDTEVFDLLQRKILPEYIKDFGVRDQLRIWVVGCSTGEEAYSIAILVYDILSQLNKMSRVSIFATDVDKFAINQARKGIYSSSIESLVNPELLHKYFTFNQKDSTYKINKTIRDMLYFSVHNAVADPPFSNIDFISCRNVLIYFDEDMQKDILSTFHYSLKDNGLLLLGISESTGHLPNAFDVVNQKAKLYKKQVKDYQIKRSQKDYTIHGKKYNNINPGMIDYTVSADTSISSIAKNILLIYSPISGTIIDSAGTIIYLQGETGNYLHPVQGSNSIGNIFEMIKDELRSNLKELLHVVMKTNRMESVKSLQYNLHNFPMHLDVTIAPLRDNAIPSITDKLFLVLFQENTNLNTSFSTITQQGQSEYIELERLQHLLRIKEESYLLTLEELNTTKQDHESMKEEMQSINEELQSTIEELETTTEELQSINEEINVTNDELNTALKDLRKLNDDFENLIDGVRLPLIFLDSNLKIKRLTETTSKIINVVETDIGRSISDFSTNFLDYDRLIQDCKKVLHDKKKIEIEVQTKDASWYTMIIRPYLVENKSVSGVSVLFIDITLRHKIELDRTKLISELEQSRAIFKSSFESAKDMMIIALDTEYKYYYYNSAHAICMKKSYGTTIEIGKCFLDFVTSEQDRKDFKKKFDQTLKGKSHSVVQKFSDNDARDFEIFFNPIYDLNKTIIGLTVFASDISKRIAASREVEESEVKFRQLYASMNQGLALHEVVLDDDGNPIDYIFLDINDSYTKITGLKRDDIIGKRVTEVIPDVEQYWIDTFCKVAVNGEPKYFENYVKALDKTFATYSYSPKHNQFAVLVSDISDRIQKEAEITYLSYNDQLTGLFNRRYYEHQLSNIDTKENVPISMIMGDVNGLKLVNDSFGHLVGDELLKKVSQSMKSACRQTDIISRIGGDEFVILLPKTDNLIAKKIVSRIIANTRATSVKSIDISISFGFGTKTSADQDLTELFKIIEDDMYRIKLSESKSMRSKTIEVIQAALYAKNDREMHHSKRVGDFCEKLALALEMEAETASQLRTAGLMHDIGKIGIAETILNKPGSLDESEWTEIKRHSEIGYRILSSTNEFSELAKGILEHHENYDGSGYPTGLVGENISVQARIIRICDSYDAMISPREYKSSLTQEQAIQELQQNSGKQFDPTFVSVFINNVLENNNG